MERVLTEHVAQARFEDLGEETVHATRLFILDTFGVAIAGLREASCRSLITYVLEQGGRAESTLLGIGSGVPAEQAALVNGTLAHALDYDEVHPATSLHSHAVVLPAALAVAERREDVSGRELLAAVAVGADLSCRLGMALREGLAPGWWPTSLLGVFGATAAAGRLLRLEPPQLRQALGIAYAQAQGNRQSMLDGGFAKPLQCGVAARAAVSAASLAQRGLTGAASFLMGPFGLVSLCAGGSLDQAPLLEELGSRFVAARLEHKVHPCCSAAQAPVQAALELVREAGLDAQHIASLRVATPPLVAEQLGRPFEPGSSRIQVQVNLPYLIAAAVSRGRLTPREVEDTAITASQDVAHLAARVQVVAVPSPGPRHAELPVSVEILTRDGVRLQRTLETSPGAPSGPRRDALLLDKARTLLSAGHREPARAWSEELIAHVLRLEHLETLTPLTATLRAIPSPGGE